jgi:hypothetical protein
MLQNIYIWKFNVIRLGLMWFFPVPPVISWDTQLQTLPPSLPSYTSTLLSNAHPSSKVPKLGQHVIRSKSKTHITSIISAIYTSQNEYILQNSLRIPHSLLANGGILIWKVYWLHSCRYLIHLQSFPYLALWTIFLPPESSSTSNPTLTPLYFFTSYCIHPFIIQSTQTLVHL